MQIIHLLKWKSLKQINSKTQRKYFFRLSGNTFLYYYQFVDKRRFFDGGTFATTAVLLDSYQLVNTMAKYDVIKTD
jgi:hypothetical protein